jgi:hypothetical protein
MNYRTHSIVILIAVLAGVLAFVAGLIWVVFSGMDFRGL